jgi:DNA-binding MarR family transcriptional regulator
VQGSGKRSFNYWENRIVSPVQITTPINLLSQKVSRYDINVARKSGGLDNSQYMQLEEFRFQIRRFLNFSEAAARASGIEPQQHQALLVLKGLPPDILPTIGHIAERLMLKHHSAVGLVDRLQGLGLVSRQVNAGDARQVLVLLTTKGERLLHGLSVAHRTELEEMAPRLTSILQSISCKTGEALPTV